MAQYGNFDIPKPIDTKLADTDPFVQFLLTVYNNGVKHMEHAVDRCNIVMENQEHFEDFIREYKLKDFYKKKKK